MVIKDKRKLKKIIDSAKREGKTVLIKGGAFDIVHPGHIHVIKKLSRYADIVVIFVMSDRAIRNKKGGSRPINGQRHRAAVIDGIRGVDYVFLDKCESRADYVRLLKFLRPSILAITRTGKGKERDYSSPLWELKELVEKEKPAFSTTKIIDKILSKYNKPT